MSSGKSESSQVSCDLLLTTLSDIRRNCDVCWKLRGGGGRTGSDMFTWDKLSQAASGCQRCSIFHSAVSALLDNDDQVKHLFVTLSSHKSEPTKKYSDILTIRCVTENKCEDLELYTLNS